jgi:hypothetical protein
MASQLPYSRVVDVSVTREDRFPTAEGFQVLLIVGSQLVSGQVDTTHRTKVYADMTEVADDFAATDEPYKAALAAFSRSPRPAQIKIGYRVAANPVDDELDLIYAADPNFYWLTFTNEVNDDATDASDAAAWAEAKNVILGLGTNDADTESAGSTAHVSHTLKTAAYERTAGFYHTSSAYYLAQSAFAYGATRNLDRSNYQSAIKGRIDSGQAYTLKFKKMPGIPPIDKGSAAVQAVTGWVPGLGLDPVQGHLCNTYVNHGGLGMLVEGNTYSGAAIDDIHSIDWIRARVQESVLGVLANTPRIPYTNAGVGFLINEGIIPPMQRALAAGIIAAGWDENNEFAPEWDISHDRVENILASQRHDRIAPDIQVRFRYAGAIHFVSVTMTVRY